MPTQKDFTNPHFSTKPKFYIIGAGRVGATLTFQLVQKGFSVISVVEKDRSRIDYLKKEFKWSFLKSSITPAMINNSNVIILTVQDSQIKKITKRLAKYKINWEGRIILHFSGTYPSSSLLPLKNLGALTASLHPIYSFSLNPCENRKIEEIWFSLEGEFITSDHIKNIFQPINMQVIRVDEHEKRVIHLACVFYANFFTALAKISTSILNKTNIPENKGLKILQPLIESTSYHILTQGISKGLTGPIKRGDIDTIKSHLDLLKVEFPEYLPIYKKLSQILMEYCILEEKQRFNISKNLEEKTIY